MWRSVWVLPYLLMTPKQFESIRTRSGQSYIRSEWNQQRADPFSILCITRAHMIRFRQKIYRSSEMEYVWTFRTGVALCWCWTVRQNQTKSPHSRSLTQKFDCHLWMCCRRGIFVSLFLASTTSISPICVSFVLFDLSKFVCRKRFLRRFLRIRFV